MFTTHTDHTINGVIRDYGWIKIQTSLTHTIQIDKTKKAKAKVKCRGTNQPTKAYTWIRDGIHLIHQWKLKKVRTGTVYSMIRLWTLRLLVQEPP